VEQTKTYRTFQFENTVIWKSGRRALLSAAEHSTLEVGSPPAFKGDPDVWCPEDLLIGGLNTCLMLTFLTMAQRRDLRVVAYESNAQGTVEHSGGKFRVTRVKVQPVVSLEEGANPAVARKVVRDTLASCIITNSVSAAVEFMPEFRGLKAE
jgi:organic hydroperoxide reductase OsmC/OhrA